jgi:hypothetical protein
VRVEILKLFLREPHEEILAQIIVCMPTKELL